MLGTRLYAKRESLSTTPVNLVSPDIYFNVKSGVQLYADKDNTGDIFIGDSNVAAGTGYLLDAGKSTFIEIDKIEKIWVVGSAATQVLHWLAI